MQEQVQLELLIQLYTIILIFQSTILSWQQLYQITKRIKPSKNGLINNQNIDDNECFKWCLVKYLHPADHNARRITKVDKDFTREIDFEDKKNSSYNWRHSQN